ncbi:UNKNOWN [Stylonychia lemnae]|uniref:Uncharacterized protein n=1 Tax=Stylonychia lemnae TaxID=5949 RepID=A0A078A6M8_STYLE|nr:UNKNOWN [Stylonychia lemnae]|eukprot:CDW76399.1 UNKNOWN [Stylonychia lemnae]
MSLLTQDQKIQQNLNKKLKSNQSLPDFSFDHSSPDKKRKIENLTRKLESDMNLQLKLKIPIQNNGELPNEYYKNTYQGCGGIISGTGIVEQINSFRMGSESTNITSRTVGGAQTSNIHQTPNVQKNPRFSLNLAFSNNSKGNNYFSTFDQGQDSFRTSRQQALLGQLSKRSQLGQLNNRGYSQGKYQGGGSNLHQNNYSYNPNTSQQNVVGCGSSQYQNIRLSEFLLKSTEKCKSTLRVPNKIGSTVPNMMSPYLSNFMNGQSPDQNEIRKVHLFTNKTTKGECSVESKERNHSKDSGNLDINDLIRIQDNYSNYNSNLNNPDFLRGVSPYQNSHYNGSPLRFNQTQATTYFNIQERFSVSSKDDEYHLSTQNKEDNTSNARSNSQNYLQKTLLRSQQSCEGINLFAINKYDDKQAKIPKVVKGNHAQTSFDGSQSERQLYQQNLDQPQILRKVDLERANTIVEVPESLQKMYQIDKMKRKVSPSLLLDNYLQKNSELKKSENQHTKDNQSKINSIQLQRQKVKERLNSITHNFQGLGNISLNNCLDRSLTGVNAFSSQTSATSMTQRRIALRASQKVKNQKQQQNSASLMSIPNPYNNMSESANEMRRQLR